MTNLRELDVVELSQIEGGDQYICTPAVVCDQNVQNCHSELVCVATGK